jgi:hypothetical protein
LTAAALLSGGQGYTYDALSYNEASPSLPIKATGFFVDICANLIPH